MGNAASAATADRAALLKIETAGRGADRRSQPAGQAQCAERRHHPRDPGLLLQSARRHRRGGDPRHRRSFLLRPRPVGTDRARRHRRPAAFADVAPGVRPHPVLPRACDRRPEGRGDRRRAGTRLRRAYPRRRALGLFRAARGPARHFRRRRRIGAAAAADRRGADDRHDADRAGSIRRPRARPMAFRSISPRPAAPCRRRWNWPSASPPMRR